MATKYENVYRHSWSEGDLVLMGQRITMHSVFADYDTRTMARVMQRTTVTDQGEAPGGNGEPRPVGVTGKEGPEMSVVEDCGGTPRSYAANVTMLPGSYTKTGSQPFSDRSGWADESHQA